MMMLVREAVVAGVRVMTGATIIMKTKTDPQWSRLNVAAGGSAIGNGLHGHSAARRIHSGIGMMPVKQAVMAGVCLMTGATMITTTKTEPVIGARCM